MRQLVISGELFDALAEAGESPMSLYPEFAHLPVVAVELGHEWVVIFVLDPELAPVH